NLTPKPYPIQAYQKRLNFLPQGYEGYSIPTTKYNLFSHPAVQRADIIHLHWVSRFLNYSFFKDINKPVIWTLHDMNPFLGGFHYLNDANRFAESFKELEADL